MSEQRDFTDDQDVEMDDSKSVEMDDSKSVDGSIIGADEMAEDDGRCGGCSLPYNPNAAPMTGDVCGHTCCEDCWKNAGGDCFKCGKTTSYGPACTMISARNITSPEPLDPPNPTPSRPEDGSDHSAKQAVAVGSQAVSAAPLCATGSHSANVVATATQAAFAPPVLTASQRPASVATLASHASAPTSSLASQRPMSVAAAPSTGQGMIEVTVKCMNGTTIKKKVDPVKTTVGDMKRAIHKDSGIHYDRQNLLHKGKTMSADTSSLASHKIPHGATIQMGTRNYGG